MRSWSWSTAWIPSPKESSSGNQPINAHFSVVFWDRRDEIGHPTTPHVQLTPVLSCPHAETCILLIVFHYLLIYLYFRVLQWVLDFFPVNNLGHRMVKSRNDKFRFSSLLILFFCVSCTLGLEVKITTGTAKVLGWNLTGPVFYSKNLSVHYLSAYLRSSLFSYCKIDVFF